MVHLLLAFLIKVIKPGWNAREERGTRATLLQVCGNLVDTMSTLPDVCKARESLTSMGMFYAVFFMSVWLNCWVMILQLFWVAEGRSLGQIPGEETHQKPALAVSSMAESGPREEQGGFWYRASFSESKI